MKKLLSFSKILCLVLSVAMILPLLAACDVNVYLNGITSDEGTTAATETESRDVNVDDDDLTDTEAATATGTQAATTGVPNEETDAVLTGKPADESAEPETSIPSTSVTTPALTTEEGTDTPSPDEVCDLPSDLNFKGKEITFLAEFEDMQEDEFYIEDGYTPMGEVIPDAVYNRNKAVERQLNVDIVVQIRPNEYLNAVHATDHQSGLAEYQVIADRTTNKGVMIVDNYYHNLKNFEHLDLTKKYWSQGFGEVVTFTKDAKQYLATGPIALSLYRSMYATIYNKDTLADKGIEDPYQKIIDGQWTLGVQKAMITDTWRDGDGDGKKSEGDYFGFISGVIASMDPYVVSSGVKLIKKDPQNYNWVYDEEQVSYLDEVVKEVQTLIQSDNTLLLERDRDHPTDLDIIYKFANQKGLMATILFYGLERAYGEIDFDYGIAPIPKYSTNQTEYSTYVQDMVTSVGVNSAVHDEDTLVAIGAVLEAMAYQGSIYVEDAYFEKLMKSRFITDPKSQKIIDIMYDSIAFDFCFMMSSCFENFRLRDELRLIISSDGSAEMLLTKNKTAITRALAKNINGKANKLP